MYFWNTNELSQNIKISKLSDNDWKNYYLAISIMGMLGLYLTALSPRENTMALLVEAISMIGILIFGISITFKTHKTNDKNVASYISKMVALSFPISIKFLVLSFGFGIILGAAQATNTFATLDSEWSITAMTVTFQALIFWRLNIHLQAINT
jgi:hypothetical protein